MGNQRSKIGNRLLSALVDASSAPGILLSKQLEIIDINNAAKSYYGLEKTSVLGEKYDLFCKRFNTNPIISNINNIPQGRIFSKAHVKGEGKTASWQVFPIENQRGDLSFVLLLGDISFDLLGLLNLYSNRAVLYLNSLISQIPEYVFWKNKDFIYLGCNAQLAKVAGLERKEDIVGKTDHDFGWRNTRIVHLRKVDEKVIRDGIEMTEEEIIPIPHTNEKRVMVTHKRPLRDENGKVIGLLGISTDITDRKKMEAALKQSKEKAEEFNKLKSKFIENMEHDLRTPLSGLEGTIASLLTNKEEGVEKQTLEFSLSSVEELKVIINSILDFENKKYGYKVLNEPFKLSQVFESIYRLYHPTANSKNLKLSYKIDSTLPRVLISDEWRIKHILINLVGNALKFTLDGEVSFEAKLIRHDDRKVLIEFVVKDTGIGIPDDKRKVIFERYVRLEGSNKGRYKGTGLGLANVKDYVDQLGGEFRPIESELNKGTTFTILISMKESLDQAMPLPSDQEKAKKDDIEFFYDLAKKPKKPEPIKAKKSKITPTQKTPSSEKPKATPIPTEKTSVLLVEDSLVAQHMAKTVIVGLDCDIDVAGSAEEALKMVGEKDYDLIFADIGLPGMDGIEMTRHIRYNERKAGKRPTPIIGQTANANAQNKKSGLESGMQDLFPKPLSTKIVTDMLQNYTAQGAQSTPAAFVPPAIKNKHVIDWDIFKSIWQDKARARDVFQDSRLDTFGTIEEFKMAYKAKDWKQVVFLAHKMRGAFIYFGCTRLEEAFSHLEDYLNETKKTDPKIIKSLYDTVLIELRSALDEIEKL